MMRETNQKIKNAFNLEIKESIFAKDNAFNGANLSRASMVTIGIGDIDYRQAIPKQKQKVSMRKPFKSAVFITKDKI